MSPKEAIEALPVLHEAMHRAEEEAQRLMKYMEREGYFNQETLDEAYAVTENLWKALRGAAKIASRMHY